MYKRRKILLAIIGMCLLVVIARLLCHRELLGIEEIKCNEIEELIAGKDEIFGLSDRLLLNGEKLAYDVKDNAFYVSQSLTEKGWQGRLSLKDRESFEKIYIIAPSEDKKEAMAKNIHYQLCYVDNSKKCYQISDLIVSGMPVMKIDGDDMTLFFAQGKSLCVDSSDVNYEQRGQTTAHYDKKSYNLKIEDGKKSLLGLRTDDDWILNALYDDMGLIHNQLSYQVWNEIAALEKWKGNYAVNQEYVELILDGEYQGVYALSERIDAKQLLMSDEDILFKVKGYPQHGGGDVIFTKQPKEPTFESDSLKAAFLDHFCRDNEIPFENSLILIDYENALDYSLFCQMAAAADNPIKNSYLVGRRALEFYKIDEIPWDCNITWGIKHFILTNEERIYDTEFKSLVVSSLWERNPEIVGRDLSERWFFLRERVLTEDNLKAILDENFGLLHGSGAYDRNYQKWPTVSVCVGEEGEILDAPVFEIWNDDSIYHYVEKRLEVLDEYYK